jgi:hypothetical protein
MNYPFRKNLNGGSPRLPTQADDIEPAYDARWIGKTINVTNTQGQIMMTVVINAKVLKIDVSSLRPGLYFISGKKDDGSVIKQKFIKL